MNKKYILLTLTFVIVLCLGVALASKNTLNGNQVLALDKTTADTSNTTDSAFDGFVMPKYDEQAIMQKQQQQMLSQMSPAERVEYQRQYVEYMKQMQMQEEYLKQKAAYEAEMRKNGGGGGSLTAQSKNRIEELKRQFEQQNSAQTDTGVIK